MGDYRVVEALATLAWEGRRTSFFRSELIAALRILDHGDVSPAHMLGSYAGAMGQPQFMPSSYLRSRSLKAMGDAISGPASPTCWGPSPITWPNPVGAAANRETSRSRCQGGSIGLRRGGMTQAAR